MNKTILFFMNVNNYHSIKWARYFSSIGCTVHIATLEKQENDEIADIPNVHVHWLRNDSDRTGNDFQKIGYLLCLRQARTLIKQVNPDILHAHFASSYGLICSLTADRDFYLSVWGNDVYQFPKKSPLHKYVLKRVLNSRCILLSTSHAMALETNKYTNKEIYVTPFGVDTDLFVPRARGNLSFRVGTVKALEKKYGIDVLIKAFAQLVRRHPDLNAELRIAGCGKEERDLKSLAEEEGIAGRINWLGFISQDQAAKEWASFDVAVVPSVSESESFGVAAVEAQSCGTPLIISDIPGLMEACNGGATALVVRRGSVGELTDALDRLLQESDLRSRLSCLGRRYVEETYQIEKCFKKVEKIYGISSGWNER